MNKSLLEKIYCYGMTYLFFMFFSLPIIWMISTAFKNQLDIFADPPVIFIKPKLINFEAVLADKQFLHALKNSILVASGTVILTMIFAIPAAYGLARLTGMIKTGMLIWILLVRAAPGMIYIIPYFVFYRIIGLIDSVYGLILINTIFTIPLVIWLLISFFEGMPISIEESAMIEGANKWQILTKISIPIAAPGIVSCAILTFIFSWNEFIFALILTNRHAKTAPIAIVNYMAYEGTEWGKVAAAGIFILLPVLIFSILIRKYLIQSVVGSGVKE